LSSSPCLRAASFGTSTRSRIGRLHVLEVHFARRRQRRIEHALLGSVRGAIANLARFRLARLLDRRLGEIADDRVDVAADVADYR
jgi:hypothetical protein